MADRVVDAVRVPKHYKNQGDQHAQTVALKAEFSAAMGGPKVLWFNSQSGDFIFIRPDHGSLYFAKDQERSGESRFEWVPADGKDGVEYGYLVEGA